MKKRGRHLADLDPEARHRVRIAAKKLRYGAEFFAALYDGKKAAKRHKVFVEALADLQDHLGDLNDIATAHTLAVELAKGAPEGAVFAAGWPPPIPRRGPGTCSPKPTRRIAP